MKIGVIGVGSMGSMALWQLARRGVQVEGFEQFGTAHDRGAGAGESRIFRTAYLEGPQYVPLLLEAQREWRELERETGRDILTITGGLMIGQRDSQFMQNVIASCEQFDLPHEILDASAVARRFPQHALVAGDMAVLDEQAGFLRPELAIASAVARAEQLGAVVHRHARVEAIEPGNGGVTVRADGEDFQFDRVVVSGGAWMGGLLPEWASVLTVGRLVITWFLARDPALWTPQRCPIWIRESEGFHFWGIPSLDGFSVKVAPDQGYGTTPRAEELDRDTRPQEFDLVNEIVRRFLPGLLPDPIRIGVYMDAFTPDGDFVVGLMPDAPRVIALFGFSGHGFKMASVMGRVAADLAEGGETSLPIGHLAPTRPLHEMTDMTPQHL